MRDAADDQGAAEGVLGVAGSARRRLLRRLPRRLASLSRPALVIACIIALVVLAGVGYGVQKVLENQLPPLHLISFDYERAYHDEQRLTSIGPRMSGTDAEGQGADYIAQQFVDAGLEEVEILTYDVLMYEVLSAEVSMVPYGPAGFFPALSSGTARHYEHTVEFVIQGYSGSHRWGSFRDDLELIDLGDGSDESAWQRASGKAGIIAQGGEVTSNSVLFFKARDFGLSALVLHNIARGEELGFIPISKTAVLLPGESQFPDLPFLMVSKSVGEEMKQLSGSHRLRLDISTFVGERPIRVVSGIVRGSQDQEHFIMLGAHHDTVYNGNGAVDDTSGTSTIIELARQLAPSHPKRTIRLSTWGGEEEGLYGSNAWAAAHEDLIANGLVYYFNFDMNHVDLERCDEITAETSTNATVDAYRQLIEMGRREHPDLFSLYTYKPEYNPDIPGNSDHAPFQARGRPVSFIYGCGSFEYHTYKDGIDRIDPRSLAVTAMIQGSYALALAQQ